MKKTLFSLLVVVMLLAILIPVAAAMPAPEGQGRGVNAVCHVLGNPTCSMKTSSSCPRTMIWWCAWVGYGVHVVQQTTTVCGISYRRVIDGDFVGSYVYTSQTTCSQ